jgi:hypothetical protein
MKILRPEEVDSTTISSLKYEALSPEQLKEAYAIARAAFTAADLQRYADLDGDVSAEEVLRDLEAAQKQLDTPKTP